MSDFERAALRQELSREPIDDAETRALIERLTARDLGDDLPTLGAVAEATGHSIEDVAAQLVAIRADNDPGLRYRVERLEGVVLEHDRKLQLSPTNRPNPIVGPYGREHFKSRDNSAATAVVVVILLLVIFLFFSAISTSNRPSQPTSTCEDMNGNKIDCAMLGIPTSR